MGHLEHGAAKADGAKNADEAKHPFQQEAFNAGYRISDLTYSDYGHTGGIDKAYQQLQDEYKNFACKHTSTETASWWHSLQDNLELRDQHLLPNLSIAYGADVKGELSRNGLAAPNPLFKREGVCNPDVAQQIDATLSHHLIQQYDSLMPEPGLLSVFKSEPRVSVEDLTKVVDRMVASTPFIPVDD